MVIITEVYLIFSIKARSSCDLVRYSSLSDLLERYSSSKKTMMIQSIKINDADSLQLCTGQYQIDIGTSYPNICRCLSRGGK